MIFETNSNTAVFFDIDRLQYYYMLDTVKFNQPRPTKANWVFFNLFVVNDLQVSFRTKRESECNNSINKQKNNPRIRTNKHKIARDEQH